MSISTNENGVLSVSGKQLVYAGQVGITIRMGNDFWKEVSMTLQTAGGDATPTVVIKERE